MQQWYCHIFEYYYIPGHLSSLIFAVQTGYTQIGLVRDQHFDISRLKTICVNASMITSGNFTIAFLKTAGPSMFGKFCALSIIAWLMNISPISASLKSASCCRLSNDWHGYRDYTSPIFLHFRHRCVNEYLSIPWFFFFSRLQYNCPAPSPNITEIFLPLVVKSKPKECFSLPITSIFLYMPVFINWSPYSSAYTKPLH